VRENCAGIARRACSTTPTSGSSSPFSSTHDGIAATCAYQPRANQPHDHQCATTKTPTRNLAIVLVDRCSPTMRSSRRAIRGSRSSRSSFSSFSSPTATETAT
jgi:hypothetical protein